MVKPYANRLGDFDAQEVLDRVKTMHPTTCECSKEHPCRICKCRETARHVDSLLQEIDSMFMTSPG
jgi:hypothetical protein